MFVFIEIMNDKIIKMYRTNQNQGKTFNEKKE